MLLTKHDRKAINYELIGRAIEFYKRYDYKYIEVPWLVSEESVQITSPTGVRQFSTFAGNLVASGEQSFIEIRDQLARGIGLGKYQCVTPCFRDEPELDELHCQYFLKNELIWVLEPKDDKDVVLREMVGEALDFFIHVAGARANEVKTAEGYDIMLLGHEVGSYGFRQYNDFRWIYGTGCAEPRLSRIMSISASRW